jgi:Bacteriophage minor capsid protein
LVSNIEIVNLLKVNVGGNFYPLAFPTTSPNDSSQIEVTTGTTVNGGVGRINVQVITRDSSMAKAEAKSLSIRSYLNDKTDFLLTENVQVVHVIAQQITPLYMGTDGNGRHLFSLNYNFILGV